MIDDEHTTDAAMGVLRICPCYLHRRPPMDLRHASPCNCECEHEVPHEVEALRTAVETLCTAAMRGNTHRGTTGNYVSVYDLRAALAAREVPRD